MLGLLLYAQVYAITPRGVPHFCLRRIQGRSQTFGRGKGKEGAIENIF